MKKYSNLTKQVVKRSSSLQVMSAKADMNVMMKGGNQSYPSNVETRRVLYKTSQEAKNYSQRSYL